MVDVLCAVLPAGGERLHAEVGIRAGGSAVNAAVAAADAGAEATVVGSIGDDAPGHFVEANLQILGIEGVLARDREVATGAAVALDTSVVAHRGANACLSVEDIPERLDHDALLVSGFALFQSGSADAAVAALERFRGRWAAVDLASPKLANLELAKSANVILATAAEARAVTGAEPEEAARTLASNFELAVVKLGEDGAIAAYGGRVEQASSGRIERRSPFGAGDAFAGALLVALAREQPVEEALRLACEAGARAAATSPSRDC